MKKFHAGIIIQVAAFFLIGLLVCSQITYYSQYSAAQTSVLERTEAMASDTAREVMTVVREYPAYRWLIFIKGRAFSACMPGSGRTRSRRTTRGP